MLAIYLSNPEFVEQNEGSEGESGRYDLDRWLRDWQVMQMMGSHRLGCYLQANSTPIGFVDFLEENENDGYSWLGALVVHRDYQRRGFGTEIFRCLAEHFRGYTGWTALRAGVKVRNQGGLVFLKHLGFTVLEEKSGRFTGGIQQFFILEVAL